VSFAVAAAPTPPKPTITSVKTGKKDLTNATDVTIIKENLTSNGEILIIGQAAGHGSRVAKVEVSLDGGTTWKKAMGKEQWQYRFTPLPNDTYNLILRVTNATGVISDSKTSRKMRLTYIPITLWELIQKRVDELAKTYMSRDLEGYMGFISRDYQNYPRGRHRLRRTIHNDFKSLNNIVLHFIVDQVFEIEGAIMAELYWRLTYAGLNRPEGGYVEILFDPIDQLKILRQEKDRYFGAASRGTP
jgi:hypothetical protein